MMYLGHWFRSRRAWEDELMGFAENAEDFETTILSGSSGLILIGDNEEEDGKGNVGRIWVEIIKYKGKWGKSLIRRYYLSRNGIHYAISNGYIDERYIPELKKRYNIKEEK